MSVDGADDAFGSDDELDARDYGLHAPKLELAPHDHIDVANEHEMSMLRDRSAEIAAEVAANPSRTPVVTQHEMESIAFDMFMELKKMNAEWDANDFEDNRREQEEVDRIREQINSHIDYDSDASSGSGSGSGSGSNSDDGANEGPGAGGRSYIAPLRRSVTGRARVDRQLNFITGRITHVLDDRLGAYRHQSTDEQKAREAKLRDEIVDLKSTAEDIGEKLRLRPPADDVTLKIQKGVSAVHARLSAMSSDVAGTNRGIAHILERLDKLELSCAKIATATEATGTGMSMATVTAASSARSRGATMTRMEAEGRGMVVITGRKGGKYVITESGTRQYISNDARPRARPMPLV